MSLIFAESIAEYDFMMKDLTAILRNRFGWAWTPSCFEILPVGIGFVFDVLQVDTAARTQFCAIRRSIEVLRAILGASSPTALM